VRTLNDDEKIDLLTKFKIDSGDYEFEPFCFQSKDKCHYRDKLITMENGKLIEKLGYYYYNCNGIVYKNECPAMNDKKILRKGISKFANLLYDLRNNFAHQSKIPTFSYRLPLEKFGKNNEHVITIGRTTTLTFIKTNEYEGLCSIELNPVDLYNLVMKYLSFLFNKYLQEVC